jgi:hypothetical protein
MNRLIQLLLVLLLSVGAAAETVVNNITTSFPALDTYPTHLSILGKGGLMTGLTNVSQLTNLTATGIPIERREAGMVAPVRTVANGATNIVPYTLAPNLSTWISPDKYLVDWFGAVPDGTTDSTVPINAAIAAIEASPSGGVLAFGDGVYITSGITTKTNSGKLVRIEGKNRAGIKFVSQPSTVIKLKNNSNTNLLRVVTGSGVDVSGIFFDGNSTNQTLAAPMIMIETEDVFTLRTRQEMHFTACVFSSSKGDGVYINRSEVAMTDCYSQNNKGNGFYFDGTPDVHGVAGGGSDCTFVTVNAGFNLGSGFYFYNNGGAACRFINCDSYYNLGDGVTINPGPQGGAGGIRFVMCTINDNFGNNVSIGVTNAPPPPATPSGLVVKLYFDTCIITKANNDSYADVGTNTVNGAYSDIKIYSSIYSYGYYFVNCTLGAPEGTPHSLKPKYLIEDLRNQTAPYNPFAGGLGISIVNCFLGSTSDYSTGARWPSFLSENSTMIGNWDTSENYIGGGRLTTSASKFAAPIYLDIPTSPTIPPITMFMPYTNGGLGFSFGITNTLTKFVIFEPTNGNLALPGTLLANGNFTAYGNITNTGIIQTEAVSLGSGTLRYLYTEPTQTILANFYDSVNGYYWLFKTNGLTVLPGPLSVTGDITNTASIFTSGDVAWDTGGNRKTIRGDTNQFAIQTTYGPGTNFWKFGTNAQTELPGTLYVPSGITNFAGGIDTTGPLKITGNTTNIGTFGVLGNVGITGNSALAGNVSITGNTTNAGTFGVLGNMALTGSLLWNISGNVYQYQHEADGLAFWGNFPGYTYIHKFNGNGSVYFDGLVTNKSGVAIGPAGASSTITRVGSAQLAVDGVNIPTETSTSTLTNKRITARAVAISYAASITPNADTTDVANVGQLTGNITINAPSGTPTDGQLLTFRFIQDGTGRTLTWNSAFAFGTDVLSTDLPTTASAKFEVGCRWNAADSKWRVVALIRGF